MSHSHSELCHARDKKIKTIKIPSGTVISVLYYYGIKLLKWVGLDKAETKLELQNGVSYKYIEHNLGTVQIHRLVAGRVCSIILSLFFAHSVRL